MAERKTQDYKERLNRARRRRDGRDPMRWVMIGGGVVIVLLLVVLAARLAGGGRLAGPGKARMAQESGAQESEEATAAPVTVSEAEPTLSPEGSSRTRPMRALRLRAGTSPGQSRTPSCSSPLTP